jgi:hypothetical protein
VENRMVKTPRRDSSKSCFLIFYWIDHTPTREIPWNPWNDAHSETACCSQFSSTGLQSQNFKEIVYLFCLRHGQLWKQISRVLFGFCSTYIFNRKVFESAFQWCTWKL